ncbi:phospholipase D-like domain-containing protein [Nocardioides sp.]|uniref:phospholipase D-like domain-containing protein n=1 Tax=Nocardioides sp. TaxID=35761 RepID=UPI002BA3E13A|nr:phospholipase D-like domain-containing protein [Nocardioides sp.]HSX68318.1 phospholipase D-like domain-containing protein [Nocardioides sp.]
MSRIRFLLSFLATLLVSSATITGLTQSPANADIGSCLRPFSSTPATGLHYNDPWEKDYAARRALMDRIADTPAGGRIRVTIWKITDAGVTDCLIRARLRGVTVQVLMPDAHCNSYEAPRLRRALTGTSSWVHCVDQTPGAHTLHQKSIIFDKTGGVPYVTLVGSANMTNSAWQTQWNDYFEYAGLRSQDVFSWYAKRFNRLNTYRRSPSQIGGQTSIAADGRAGAWFLPRVADRAHDPEYVELNKLPNNSSTRIRVAMFGMGGTRGNWLATELIEKKKAGAQVYFIAGPSVSNAIKDRLKAARIPVHNGYRGPDCEGSNEDYTTGTCTFSHLKMWTAYWKSNGEENFRSYTGSDNWSLNTLRNFDVIQRIGGKGSYNDFYTLFQDIWDSTRAY